MSGHLGSRAAAYVDGALTAEETARADGHLVDCPACRSQVAEQRRVRDLLRGTAAAPDPVTPPAGLLASLASMPVAGVPVRPVLAPGRKARREAARRAAVSAVAAGVAVLVAAWAVGGQVSAAGPAAVPPGALVAQHSVTAGDIPFWGSTAAPGAGSRSAASALLRRSASASTSVSYRAVQLLTTQERSGPVTSAREVSHAAGRGTSIRALGGEPGASTFRPVAATATSVGLDAVGLLDRSYDLAVEGSEAVAGRPADRVAVRDASGVLVARFWLDTASGLPLARDLRSPDGTPIRSSTFSFVSVSDDAVMPRHLPVATTSVWADAETGTAPEPLEAQGWVCPESLAAASGLTAFDARLTDGPNGSILHLVYTDGLRSLSVFQQRAKLDVEDLDGFEATDVSGHPVFLRAGSPVELTWGSGPMVFTVVGDGEVAAVDAVVAALPHQPVATGSRTGRGLARVGSWLDPFG